MAGAWGGYAPAFPGRKNVVGAMLLHPLASRQMRPYIDPLTGKQPRRSPAFVTA